jgi:hypothetical protein
MSAAAVPPQPSQGTAVVDGEYCEWSLPVDFFANMYRAGRPEKPLESKLYLRYDCVGKTMYALVLAEPGVIGRIDSLETTAWIAIGTHNRKAVNELAGNDGVPPDFAWVARAFDGDPWHVLGYEASFPLEPGGYIIIAHMDVWDATRQTSATTGFPGSGPQLEVHCPTNAIEAATLGAIKALFR